MGDFSQTSTKVGLGVLLFQILSFFVPEIAAQALVVGTGILGGVEILRDERKG